VSSARRAAYADGVIAAADALMQDLENLGSLDDAEVLVQDDDARGVCSLCQMRRLGYGGLADRLEFAHGVARAGAGA
jgi:hypothetical protein